MKFISPAFGLMSGFWTAIGLLPHILSLCVFLTTRIPRHSVTALIVFTIGAKLLVEWLFWKHCFKRMDSEAKLKNWRAVANQSLLSHPNVIVSLVMALEDTIIDASLVYIALKIPIPSIWVFLALLGSQALSSTIQGFLSDIFSRKKSLLFACIMGILAFMTARAISLDGNAKEVWMSPLLHLLGLASFTPATQMLLILCGKGLFGNLTVIARAAVAEVIAVETIENFNKV